MESLAYTSEENKIHDPSSQKKGTVSFLNSQKKRWIFWGVLGALFILLYTGGSYYVLFSMKKTKPVPPSSLPQVPTATPYPTPTAVPTVTPTAVNTVTWKTYTNKKYGFSLQFPSDLIPSFNKTESDEDPFLITLSTPNSSPSGVLSINVQDSAYIGQSDVESRAIINLSLLNFASKKRELNFAFDDEEVPNRGVSALLTTTFLGKPAYSFAVSGSYLDDRNYLLLEEEYTYLFTQNGDYKIIISYPTDDSLLKQVLETIRFE